MPDQIDKADPATPDSAPAETATQKLAAIVARKKADAGGGRGTTSANAQAARQAAARSANKSKPALRK